MTFEDFDTRPWFTAEELEHILGLPLAEIVELFARVPKVAPGQFQGDACRDLIAKYARKRVFADLIARQAVNAVPDIRRAGDQPGEGHEVALEDRTNGVAFTVRFPGDLRNYLAEADAASRSTEVT